MPIEVEIRRVWNANLAVYGVKKGLQQFNREGIRVARRTVEPLMGELGLKGAVRGRACRVSDRHLPPAE